MQLLGIGVLVFIVVVVFAGVSMIIAIYNGLVSLKKQVERSWANIDVILKQRHDEIPQIISICEQFAGYERATIDRVIQARKSYGAAASINEKVKAAGEVSAALRGIMAIGEAYPELKSSEHFLQLQKRISDLEGAIADRREHFNETVTNYNTRLEQFPDLFFARMLNYSPMSLYQVSESEKTPPSIKVKLPV